MDVFGNSFCASLYFARYSALSAFQAEICRFGCLRMCEFAAADNVAPSCTRVIAFRFMREKEGVFVSCSLRPEFMIFGISSPYLRIFSEKIPEAKLHVMFYPL